MTSKKTTKDVDGTECLSSYSSSSSIALSRFRLRSRSHQSHGGGQVEEGEKLRVVEVTQSAVLELILDFGRSSRNRFELRDAALFQCFTFTVLDRSVSQGGVTCSLSTHYPFLVLTVVRRNRSRAHLRSALFSGANWPILPSPPLPSHLCRPGPLRPTMARADRACPDIPVLADAAAESYASCCCML